MCGNCPPQSQVATTADGTASTAGSTAAAVTDLGKMFDKHEGHCVTTQGADGTRFTTMRFVKDPEKEARGPFEYLHKLGEWDKQKIGGAFGDRNWGQMAVGLGTLNTACETNWADKFNSIRDNTYSCLSSLRDNVPRLVSALTEESARPFLAGAVGLALAGAAAYWYTGASTDVDAEAEIKTVGSTIEASTKATTDSQWKSGIITDATSFVKPAADSFKEYLTTVDKKLKQVASDVTSQTSSCGRGSEAAPHSHLPHKNAPTDGTDFTMKTGGKTFGGRESFQPLSTMPSMVTA